MGILCGKGNNGGDGLVVGRLLKQKKASVVVILTGEEEDLAPEAKNQYHKAKAAKVPIIPLLDGEGMKTARAALEECDLLVDALFGTGL
ncbi:MAG TPA: NAD(P)H-hydrate epimerase, partial [bacterium]|nr:NAD(P)H-hydrate epimerase [bacterium]